MIEKTLNLRGLKCPLPALRTKKALSKARPGDIFIVECTDPLTAIDIAIRRFLSTPRLGAGVAA